MKEYQKKIRITYLSGHEITLKTKININTDTLNDLYKI